MKKILSCLLVVASTGVFAQNRAPKMEPIYAEGYYVNQRRDTIRGEIQVNRTDETLFYQDLSFRKKGATKPRVMKSNLVRAYGFDDRHFVLVNDGSDKFFAERLAYGRLAFYEYRLHGKIDGLPAVVSAYFIRDTWKPLDTKAKEIPVAEVNEKFYKKSLKPYMKEEQPMIWSDLDKFTFQKHTVVNAINEFNSYYADKAN